MLFRVLDLETLARFCVSLNKIHRNPFMQIPITPRHAETGDLYLFFKSVLFVNQEMRFVLGYQYRKL